MTDPAESKDKHDAGLVNVFDDFLLEERNALKLPCGKEQLAEPCGSALAISGGGIRSASFALGVMLGLPGILMTLPLFGFRWVVRRLFRA